ncbi:MAG: NUDIX hydrolase [Bryobacterales bacterium]|nr:NUDIX hydrolase [Bryobacterales bacterium]
MLHHERYRFCPCCGSEYGAGAHHPSGGHLHCQSCAYRFYQNAKPSCTAVIADPGDPERILLLTRSTQPHIGKLALPGGFIDYGESPEAALAREVLEETELEVVSSRLLCVTSFDYEYLGGSLAVIEMAFWADVGSSRLSGRTTSEASRLAFYSIQETLADVSQLAFAGHASVLRQYLTALQNG